MNSLLPVVAALALLSPSADAVSEADCESLLAANHEPVFERLQGQLAAMTEVLEATLVTLQAHDEMRAASELALACYHDDRNANKRKGLWRIHWSYFHVTQSLHNFAFRIQETGRLENEKRSLLINVAYALGSLRSELNPQ